jgi:hypothetical protein
MSSGLSRAHIPKRAKRTGLRIAAALRRWLQPENFPLIILWYDLPFPSSSVGFSMTRNRALDLFQAQLRAECSGAHVGSHLPAIQPGSILCMEAKMIAQKRHQTLFQMWQSKQRRICALAGLALLCQIALVPLRAQSTNGVIDGTIEDATQATLAGASVTATNVATSVHYKATSNQLGYYTIPFVPPGQYTIEATLRGFRTLERTGVVVQVNETAHLNLVLQAGSVAETVTVTGAAPVIDTEQSSVADVVSHRAVVGLPLNGRNVYSLEELMPGAAPDNVGLFRFNGVRARSNEILVDGVSQIPPETRSAPISPPPIDAIDEFRIATSGYTAEFGSAAGGIINVATKAGTNSVHGDAWEFLRNDVLNTANYFTPAGQKKPILRQNQFGGTIGGPVWLPRIYNGHDKTFFFADYEGVRIRSQKVFDVTVPTTAERGGDLSAFLGPQAGTDGSGNPIYKGEIFDPSSTQTVNGVSVRTPFAGNIIPPDRIDPVAKALLAYYPSPSNQALSNNLQNATSTGSNTDRYDIRVDENISSRNRVFGRWSNYTSNPLQSVPFRGAAGDFDSDTGYQRSLSTSFITTISSSLFNEARGLFLQAKTNNIPYLHNENIAQTLGIGNITNQAGLPEIDTSSIQQLGNSASGSWLVDNQRMFDVIDNLTYLHGKNNMKAGIEIRFYRLKNFQPSFDNGYFAFRSSQTAEPGTLSTTTGNAFASFLLGEAYETQYTETDPGQIASEEYYGGFFQDDRKETNRLTLNLGLRYEVNSRITPKHGYSSTFDIATGKVLAGAARPIPSLDLANIAPRVGLAYDVFGNSSMLIRSGFGIFYSPITGMGGNPLNGLPKFPYAFTSTVVSPDTITPVSTLSAGPVLLPTYPIDSPQLGYGAAVQIQSKNTAPYVYQWNLGIEHTIGRYTAVDVSYVGSASHKFDIGRLNYENIDQVPYSVAKQAAIDQNTINPNTQSLLPWPNFQQVQYLNPRWGNSFYNSLQLQVQQHMHGGFTYMIAYTFAKYIDNGSESYNSLGGDWAQDVYNLRLERADSTAEIPQHFAASYNWDLPFGSGRAFPVHGLLDSIVGGWQINGIVIAQDGQPVDVEQSTITSSTYSLLQRPNLNGNPILHSSRSVAKWFNTSAFSAAAPQSIGTSPRNPLRSPGLTDADMALVKSWHVHDASSATAVDFRLEGFNITNTPPLVLATRTTYNPSLTLAQQSFGQITTANAGRVLQVALKVHF